MPWTYPSQKSCCTCVAACAAVVHGTPVCMSVKASRRGAYVSRGPHSAGCSLKAACVCVLINIPWACVRVDVRGCVACRYIPSIDSVVATVARSPVARVYDAGTMTLSGSLNAGSKGQKGSVEAMAYFEDVRGDTVARSDSKVSVGK